jgi:hypothetical protein
MRKITLALAVLGATLSAALYTAPAYAQATRTWVSGVGDDANPCSRTAPCKTFAGSISKTAPRGEINCLDPGGFGAVTITKAISIICGENGESGVLVSGTNGIIVQAGPNDNVILQGIDFEGLGTGVNGVLFNSGLALEIIKCTIHDFATNGVNVASNTANARVVIKDSNISFNGVNGTANTGGVNVQGNGVTNIATIVNSVMLGNQNYDVQVTGAANFALIANNTLVTGLSIVNGGNLISSGPSNIIGGGTNPSQTQAFK